MSSREAFKLFGESYDAFAIVRAVIQIMVIGGTAVVIWMNLDFRVQNNAQGIAALHGRVQTMGDVLSQFPVHSNQMTVMQRELDGLRRQVGAVSELNSTIATLTERIDALRAQMQRLENQMSRQLGTYGR